MIKYPWAFPSPGWRVPALSAPAPLKDASVPVMLQASLWPCLSSPGEPRDEHSAADGASLVLSGEGSPCVTCWQHYCSPGYLLTAFATRLYFWLMVSLLCTRFPGHSLQSFLPASPSPGCAGAWECSFPGTGVYITPCWASWDSSWPISSTSKWQHSHLVYQPFLTVCCLHVAGETS